MGRKHIKLTLIVSSMMLVAMWSCKDDSIRSITKSETVQNDTLASDSAKAMAMTKQVITLFNFAQDDSLRKIAPQAMEFCSSHGQFKHFYYIWNIMAETYVWGGEFHKAIEEAQHMYDDAIYRNNDYGKALANSLLGTAYSYQGDWTEAARYYKQALKFYPSNADQGYLNNIYNYYCNVLEKDKDYATLQSVLVDWKKNLDKYPVATKKDKTSTNGHCLYHIKYASYLLNIEQYKEAISAIDSVAYYTELHGNLPLHRSALAGLRCRLALGQKHFQQALVYADQKIELGKQLDESNYRAGLDCRFQALEGLGRYKEALELVKLLSSQNDSLMAADNRKRLNELNKRFEVDELKAQQQMERLASKNRQTLGLFVTAMITVIGLAVFIFFRHRAAKRLEMAHGKLKKAYNQLEETTAAKERIESELRIAREIQMSMVPHRFPERSDLDLYATMEPAKEVGGDLYDFIIADHKLFFTVGDVSGKGVPASMLMAVAVNLFRTLAKSGFSPASIATHLNNALSAENENGMFVTMFIGLVDLQTGHLQYCNAGHNPPLLDGEFMDVESNAPIGLWSELDFVGQEVESIKGKKLFIYSDGLNEAENIQQHQFGDDRLQQLVRQLQSANSQDTINHLQHAVSQFVDDAEQSDDLTMMSIMVK